MPLYYTGIVDPKDRDISKKKRKRAMQEQMAREQARLAASVCQEVETITDADEKAA